MPAASDPTASDLFAALAHPLRRRILHRMVENGGETSPRELADDLGQTLSGLSYHVRVLAACGAVELVGAKKVRGATQHFYRAAVEAQWARMALEASAEDTGEGGR